MSEQGGICGGYGPCDVYPALRSEERNANERGVVVHTCNPSRLETGTSSTSTEQYQYRVFKASLC